MSPRRQDSEETLVNIGDDDKLDGTSASLFMIGPSAEAHSSTINQKPFH
jgi:hypothetical protein